MRDELFPVTGLPGFEPEHPGAILREEFLEPMRVSVSEAAERVGVTRQTLHRVLAGTSAVSAEMALRLSRFTGAAAMFWLNLQAMYDLWHGERELAGELRRIRPASGVRRGDEVAETMASYNATRRSASVKAKKRGGAVGRRNTSNSEANRRTSRVAAKKS